MDSTINWDEELNKENEMWKNPFSETIDKDIERLFRESLGKL